MRTAPFFADLLARRLPGAALDWFKTASSEIAGGVDDQRFAALLSLASRHARRTPLAPSAEERAQAGRLLPGFDPERWRPEAVAGRPPE